MQIDSERIADGCGPGEVRCLDYTAPFRIRVNGKEMSVRFPVDSEICRWYSKNQCARDRVRVHRSLLECICGADCARGLSDETADRLLGRFLLAEPLSCLVSGAIVTVDLLVLSGQTRHVLNIPSQGEMTSYLRGSVREIEEGWRRKKFVRLEPAGLLYDHLFCSCEGYVGQVVPIWHKSGVISRVVDLLFEGNVLGGSYGGERTNRLRN